LPWRLYIGVRAEAGGHRVGGERSVSKGLRGALCLRVKAPDAIIVICDLTQLFDYEC